jgi:nucleoside-diphosphate-sugar epimerase
VYDDVARAIQGCDLVFHTAVRNNTDIELESYEEFHSSNVVGTFNVFLAGLRSGVKRIVHSSSSVVNGFYMSPPSSKAIHFDDDAPKRGVDIYALTKIVGEMHADYFRDVHDMSIISLRYGWLAPQEMYQDPAMIFNTLQFCFHEDDALAANLLVMNQQSRGNYLICAAPAFTDEDAEELLANPAGLLDLRYPKELAYLREIGFQPTPITGWLDCSRAMRELNYRPKYSFEDFVRMHRDGVFAEG